jgi:thioredoxin-like negative regulator of GroEL
MPYIVISNDSDANEFQEASTSEPYVLLYHMSTCPHCVAMQPAWKEAVKTLKNKCNLAAIEYHNIEHLPRTLQNVNGVPALKLIMNGKPLNEYSGDRSAQSLIDWILANAEIKGGSKRKASTAAKKKPATAKKPVAKRKVKA